MSMSILAVGLLALCPGTSAAAMEDIQRAPLDAAIQLAPLPAQSPPSSNTMDEISAGETETTPLDATMIEGIQRELVREGYDPGPVDGRVGPKTRNAIAQYQSDGNLPVTGEASPSLYDRLASREANPRQPTDKVFKAPAPAVDQSAGAASDAPPAPGAQQAAIEPTTAVERWQPYSDRRTYSSLEMAIISVFDFMRDSALFAVSQFADDDPVAGRAANEVAQSEVADNVTASTAQH